MGVEQDHDCSTFSAVSDPDSVDLEIKTSAESNWRKERMSSYHVFSRMDTYSCYLPLTAQTVKLLIGVSSLYT